MKRWILVPLAIAVAGIGARYAATVPDAQASTTVAPSTPLSWESAFPAGKAPESVRFAATYSDPQGRSHTLTQWRDADRRLRRDTDAAVSIFVTKQGDGEYAHQVVDRRAGVQVEVSRTNLQRLGIFSDWEAMATNLTREAAAYSLSASARGVERTKVGTCRFVRVEAKGTPAREICWSEEWALPLLIEVQTNTGTYQREYTVDEVARDFDRSALDAPSNRYAEIDANEELGNDD